MIDKSKVFVCVIFHQSKLRPRGYEMAENFCNAWKHHNMPYQLIVLDNESDCQYECLEGIEHTFIRIDDQMKTGGVTGGWNLMYKHAYDNGAEIITGFADDVQLNDTFHMLIQQTISDDIIYAPITDGMKAEIWPKQYSRQVLPGQTFNVSSINGFWMSFTRKFWETRQVENELFPMKNEPYLDKWASQEKIIDTWINKGHTSAVVIGDCWIHHTKLQSWREARHWEHINKKRTI